MTLCSEKTSYTTEAAAMQAAQGRVTNAPLRLFVYDIAKRFFEIRTRY